jgi:hypothetical protein
MNGDTSFLINLDNMKRINENAYSVLMSFTRFVRDQQTAKRQFLTQKFEELYDELRVQMDFKGWSAKGRNNVTETMINNSTCKFKFSKVYSGQEVVVELQSNIKDDYLPYGYNQLKVTPEVPGIIRNISFFWDEQGNTMLGLSILLDKIDAHFNQ